VITDLSLGLEWVADGGRVVVFQSEATNLSENDMNGVTDIFYGRQFGEAVAETMISRYG
jgi:hypothetical protein